MFRTTVTADENTDVNVAVSDLRSRCENNGVAAHVVDGVAEQLRSILQSLVSNGKVLSAQGSQLKVTRDIAFEGTEVRLVFGSGIAPSGWRNFLHRLFGR